MSAIGRGPCKCKVEKSPVTRTITWRWCAPRSFGLRVVHCSGLLDRMRACAFPPPEKDEYNDANNNQPADDPAHGASDDGAVRTAAGRFR